MTGSDGSLSLSEITVSSKEKPSKLPHSKPASYSVDDDIELWRNLDNGLPCLLDKAKQDITVAKEVLNFFKKRAAIEEEYARQLIRLSQSMLESHDRQQFAPDTLTHAWSSILRIHESIGDQRQKFSAEISEVAEDIAYLVKDIEKKRKMTKDLSVRHERVLGDADLALSKAKQRYDLSSEEWETKLMQQKNDAMGLTLKGMFKQNRNQMQLNKIEDDARTKAVAADEQYKQQLSYINRLRKDYYDEHLPKMLSALKMTDNECCVALRYQFSRYDYAFEQAVVANGKELDDDEGGGLRTVITKIDMDTDLRNYINGQGGRMVPSDVREAKYEKYEMAVKIDDEIAPKPIPPVKSRSVFGVDLDQLLKVEGGEVPIILRICAQTIEAYGLHNQGIYRLSGAASHIRKVKALVESGKTLRNGKPALELSVLSPNCSPAVAHPIPRKTTATTAFHLTPEDYSGDINSVTGALKLWFRELPNPLIPRQASERFIAAAKCEDERLRIVILHTAINDLPDANYATLRYLVNHLDKIQQHKVYNKMGIPNLAIIFGPTLMGGDKEGYTFDESKILQDMQWHVRIVEIILENYRIIFEPEDE